jgi:hypothetical protein
VAGGFFTLETGERLLLDVEAGQAAMLMQRLMRFRLRSKVEMRRLDGWVRPGRLGRCAAARPAGPPPPEAGWRLMTDAPSLADADEAAYDAHRLALGLPGWLARHGGGALRPAGGRLRRTARRQLDQGLLHGARN